jgi:nicotinate dehydrogenase subunit A
MSFMPQAVRIRVNGQEHVVDAAPDTPLLYVLRNDLGLVGARFGCGQGQCGACFVIVDGHAVASCDTPRWSVADKSVTAIGGLGGGTLHPLRRACAAAQALQCGYCASGVVMSAAALLARNASATDAEIIAALERNLCRCGAHNRMLRAIRRAMCETDSA